MIHRRLTTSLLSSIVLCLLSTHWIVNTIQTITTTNGFSVGISTCSSCKTIPSSTTIPLAKAVLNPSVRSQQQHVHNHIQLFSSCQSDNSSTNRASQVWTIITFAIISTFVLPSICTAADTNIGVGDITNGSILFEANCAGCHRNGANYIKESKTLQKDALEKYLSLDKTIVQNFVQNKMPHTLLPFKKEFTSNNYQDVTTFVVDQAINNKW